MTAVGRALSRSRRIGASPAVLDMFIARSVDVTPPRMRFVITCDLVESRNTKNLALVAKLLIRESGKFYDVASHLFEYRSTYVCSSGSSRLERHT